MNLLTQHLLRLHPSCASLNHIIKRTVKKVYRGQDPKLVKSMPVFQYAPDVMSEKKRKTIYLWGYVPSGALGNINFILRKRPDKKGVLRPVPPLDSVPNPFHLKFIDMKTHLHDVACGNGFTVIAADVSDANHKLFGCGINTDSQIGCHFSRDPKYHKSPLEILYNPVPIYLPIEDPKVKVIKVACGRAHTVCLTNDGNLYSLGNNSFGQCGRPIVEDEIYLASNKVHHVKGVDGNVTQIVCGEDHTLFLTDKGEVYSCGWGADGQTGMGHFQNVPIPTKVKGDIDGEVIKSISSAADCCLAVNDKGDIFGWGNSEYSQFEIFTQEKQLNIPRRLNFKNVGKVVKAAAGGTMCALINDQGQVFVWGYGILGKGPKVSHLSKPSSLPMPLFGRNESNPNVKVADIYAGLSHFAAVTSDLFMWGKNSQGNLGIGHEEDQYFPYRVCLPATVKKVSLGMDHTAVIVTPAT